MRGSLTLDPGRELSEWRSQHNDSLSERRSGYCNSIAIAILKLQLKRVSSQVLRDSAGFPLFTVRNLVQNLSVWCAVFVTSRHITHYRRKTVKSRIFFVFFFCLMFVVSHILKIL